MAMETTSLTATESNTAEPQVTVAPSVGSCQTKPLDEATTAMQKRKAPLSLQSSVLPLVQASITPSMSQQACSCGGGQSPQLVYAIGALWFDFGTEARHDLFVQQLGDPVRANNPTDLITFLRKNPEFGLGLTFILMQAGGFWPRRFPDYRGNFGQISEQDRDARSRTQTATGQLVKRREFEIQCRTRILMHLPRRSSWLLLPPTCRRSLLSSRGS